MSLNLYTYANNNPVRYVDPSGHAGEEVLGFALLDGPEPGPADLVVIIYYTGYNAYLYGPDAINYVNQYGPAAWGKAKDVGGYVVDKAGEGINYAKQKTSDGINFAKDKAGKAKNWVEKQLGGSSGGSPDPNKNPFKINVSKSAQRVAKKLSPEAKKAYEKSLDALKSGDYRGLNNHPLTGNRAGQWAIDIKGIGKGRGAGRIIYEILSDGTVEILEITTKHNY